MVPSLRLPTQEETPEKEFQPREKYGLLVAGKNFNTGFRAVPDYPRWHPGVFGNIAMYDWEVLMTGTIDLGEKSPLNALDKVVASSEARISRVPPREVIRESFGKMLEFHHDRNGGYQEVAKVWPGTEEVSAEFAVAAKRIADRSGEDTLTTIIISSHGLKGSIKLGDCHLEYKSLLEGLDKIGGKKVVLVYACHSGSFLEALQVHPQRRDYAAIASSPSDSKSTTWNDKAVDQFLFRHFGSGGRLSEIDLNKVHAAVLDRNSKLPDEYKQPQMLRYFDVRLI